MISVFLRGKYLRFSVFPREIFGKIPFFHFLTGKAQKEKKKKKKSVFLSVHPWAKI